MDWGQLYEMFSNFWNNDTTQTVLYTVLALIVTVGIRVLTSSNKKAKGYFDQVLAVGSDISKTKNSTTILEKTIGEIVRFESVILEREQIIDAKITMLGEILKDFVKATKIGVDDKLQIAKQYDEFKKLLLPVQHGITNTIELGEHTTEEFIAHVKQEKQDAIARYNEYLNKISQVANKNENDN